MYVFGSGQRMRRGGERIGFGLYQSCGNRESVGHVFGWCRWRCYVSVSRLFGVDGRSR